MTALRRARLLAALALAAACAQGEDATRPRNVLFVLVDDLRTDLGCYGDPSAHSPHLDALAARGTVFSRAYSQAVICNPSRASLLTGLRPTTTGLLSPEAHFRDHVPDVVTLPQHLRAHGFHTVASGKVFDREDPPSWDELVDLSDVPKYLDPETAARLERDKARAREAGLRRKALLAAVQGPLAERLDVGDDAYHDGAATAAAVAFLQSDRARSEPFFLAVGFRRPHLPHAVPERYWALHEDRAYRPPAAPAQGAPPFSLNKPNELKAYAGVPKRGPVDDELGLRIQRGYRACVSYVDAQLGRLTAALEAAGLADDTVVVVTTDQGFKLGEHGAWGKNALHETDTRVPLVVAVPGRPPGVTDAIVELVDLFPTLCELAGVPGAEHVEGTSFAPLLADPGREWKSGALTHVLRAHDDATLVGEALRTERHRLVRWQRQGAPDQAVALELYDHGDDPGERLNLAGEPAHRERLDELLATLAGGWRALAPERVP